MISHKQDTTPTISPCGAHTLPPMPVMLSAAQAFAVGVNTIVYIGVNFRTWFLDASSNVSRESTIDTLCVATLRIAHIDERLIPLLGGVQNVALSLGDLFRAIGGFDRSSDCRHVLYVAQPVTKGCERGKFVYRVNDREVSEIVCTEEYLYVVDDQWYVLRGVCVRWHNGGWHINAYPIERSPAAWRAGYRAYCRTCPDTE